MSEQLNGDLESIAKIEINLAEPMPVLNMPDFVNVSETELNQIIAIGTEANLQTILNVDPEENCVLFTVIDKQEGEVLGGILIDPLWYQNTEIPEHFGKVVKRVISAKWRYDGHRVEQVYDLPDKFLIPRNT